MEVIDWNKIFEELDKYPLILDAVSAELADEDKPDGDVVFRNKDGAAVAMMPREVYEEL